MPLLTLFSQASTGPICVQSSAGSLGTSGTGARSFASAQTAQNINLVFVNAIGAAASTTDVSSITDDAGNTYVKLAFVSNPTGGAAGALWLWGCLRIAPRAAGNAVALHASSTGVTYAMAALEYPAYAIVRGAFSASQNGGTAVVPAATLTGTTAGDIVVVCGVSKNIALGTAGSIGIAAASLVATTGNLGTEDGFSDGTTPLVATFGATTDNAYTMLAVALGTGIQGAQMTLTAPLRFSVLP